MRLFLLYSYRVTLSVFYKPVFTFLKDWSLFCRWHRHTGTNTCTHTHTVYIHTINTHTVHTLWHSLRWKQLWFFIDWCDFSCLSSPFFPICALFILVRIFTEAEQYLPMWRFYQVQARKFKWNLLHHRSFFSATLCNSFSVHVLFLICLTLNWGGPVLHCRA